jgi:hypothetical protein
LQHLGGVAGIGREPLTRGEQEKREREMAKELTARLKKQGFDTERIANKLMQHEG